jgi:hypothetical protein
MLVAVAEHAPLPLQVDALTSVKLPLQVAGTHTVPLPG